MRAHVGKLSANQEDDFPKVKTHKTEGVFEPGGVVGLTKEH